MFKILSTAILVIIFNRSECSLGLFTYTELFQILFILLNILFFLMMGVLLFKVTELKSLVFFPPLGYSTAEETTDLIFVFVFVFTTSGAVEPTSAGVGIFTRGY